MDSRPNRLIDLCSLAYGPTSSNEERTLALQAIIIFRGGAPDEVLTCAGNLLEYWERDDLHCVAWNMIQYQVRHHWNSMGSHWNGTLRRDVLSSASRCPLSPSRIRWTSHASQAIVEIALHCWPDDWPQFVPSLKESIRQGPGSSSCLLAFAIIRRLVEELISMPTEGTPRPNGITKALNVLIKEILPLSSDILQWQSEVPDDDAFECAKQVMGFVQEVFSKQVENSLYGCISQLIPRIIRLLGTPVTHYAADCLMVLTEKRKGIEKSIVSSVLCKDLMKKVDHLLVDIQTNTDPFADEYILLKIFARLLDSISPCMTSHFKWDLNTRWYCSTMGQFIQHPSLKLRLSGMEGLVNLMQSKVAMNTGDFGSAIISLATVAPEFVKKDVLCSCDAPTLSTHYSKGDYVSDTEVLLDLNRLRLDIAKIVDVGAERCMKEMLTSFEKNYLNKISDPRMIASESDGWNKFIRQVFAALKKNHKVFTSEYDGEVDDLISIVRQWPTIIIKRIEKLVECRDWSLINELLSIVNGIQAVTARDRSIMKQFVRLITVILKHNPEEDKIALDFQLEVKRHSLAGILSMLDHDFEAMKDYQKILYEMCVSVYDYVTLMQQGTLAQIVAHLSNACDEENRAILLDQALLRPKKFLQSNMEHFETIQTFTSFCGFERAVDDREAEDAPHIQRRKDLRANIMQLEGVLKVARVNVIREMEDQNTERDMEEEDEYINNELKPLFIAICKISTFMLRFTYESRQHMHYSSAEIIVQRSYCDVLNIIGKPVEELEEMYQEDKDTPLGKAKKFFNELMETLTNLMTVAAARVPQTFGYCFGHCYEYWKRIGWAHVPSHRHRPWLRRFWKELASHRKWGTISMFWIVAGTLFAGLCDVQIADYTRLRDAASSYETLLRERELSAFAKDIITTIRSIMLVPTGDSISSEAESPSSLVSSNHGNMLLNNLLLAMRTAETSYVTKAANCLNLACDEMRNLRSIHCGFLSRNNRNVMGVALITLAQHGKEQQASSALSLLLFNLVEILSKHNYNFVEEVAPLFFDRRRAADFVENVLEGSVNIEDKKRRQIVQELMDKIVSGGNHGRWLHTKYEHVFDFRDHSDRRKLFDLWGSPDLLFDLVEN